MRVDMVISLKKASLEWGEFLLRDLWCCLRAGCSWFSLLDGFGFVWEKGDFRFSTFFCANECLNKTPWFGV